MVSQAVWLMTGYPTDLGTPEQIYQQDRSSRTMMIARVSLWLAVAFASIYVAFLGAASANDSDRFSLIFVLSVMVIAFLVVLAIPLLRRLRRFLSEAHDIAALCPNGLAYFHDGEWQSVRWSDVVNVEIARESRPSSFDPTDRDLWLMIDLSTKLLRGYMRHYAITTNTDDRIRLGETLTGIDELMRTIRDRTFPMRLSRAQQALLAGEKVRFGPITISQTDGMNCNGTYLAWDRIDSIEELPEDTSDNVLVRDETKYLRINSRHHHLTFPERAVPNTDVLLFIAVGKLRPTD